MEVKIEAVIVFASCLAVVIPSQEVAIFAMCLIGAVCGGYIGGVYFAAPSTTVQTVRTRWFANICCGISGGPFLAGWLAPQFPDISGIYVALASGGAVGVAGVLFLTMAIPAFFKWIAARLNTPKDPKDPDKYRMT